MLILHENHIVKLNISVLACVEYSMYHCFCTFKKLSYEYFGMCDWSKNFKKKINVKSEPVVKIIFSYAIKQLNQQFDYLCIIGL